MRGGGVSGGGGLLLLLLAASPPRAAPAPAAAFLPAASPLAQWSGRFASDASGAVAMDWGGTSVSFVVEGAGASVTLLANVTLYAQDAARVAVFVNDVDSANLFVSADAASYLVAAALPLPVNNVTLVYASEPGQSGASRADGRVVRFLGFSAGGGGAFAPPPPPRARRIDVVGDSMTAWGDYDRLEAVGGALSLGTGCPRAYAPLLGSSQSATWAAFLARCFRANASTTAWSGRGLAHNSGCAPGALLPELYQRTFGSSAAEPWNFAATARPDLVLIFLGTNDYYCNETTDAGFTAAMLDFMRNVTAAYAASPGPARSRFMLGVGPMSPRAPLAALLAAVAAGAAEGLAVSLLDMRNATLDGCGGHPGPSGQWELALQAAPQIREAMGW